MNLKISESVAGLPKIPNWSKNELLYGIVYISTFRIILHHEKIVSARKLNIH